MIDQLLKWIEIFQTSLCQMSLVISAINQKTTSSTENQIQNVFWYIATSFSPSFLVLAKKREYKIFYISLS